MAARLDGNDHSDAEKQHLLQTIEILRNLTKDYTLKYKEKEIELTNKFKQKEAQYLFQIESLKQQINGYESEAHHPFTINIQI